MRGATTTSRPPTPSPRAFSLDRERAIEAVAVGWGLEIGEPGQWRLDRFGAGLGESLELLAGVLFAPARGLVSGPDAEVRVFALPDPHASPLLVCVDAGAGPMLCDGVDDVAAVLPDPWGSSPDLLAEALQQLLDLASAVLRGAGRVSPGVSILQSDESELNRSVDTDRTGRSSSGTIAGARRRVDRDRKGKEAPRH